ncbi:MULTISPECIES: response regulator [Halorussus]|uniref:response regulator n=1 Tax=Halorussus TaxID=1070314 RepID=UPI000E215E58|nr:MULTISPECIES: response regulator [Halorussus]NHN57749.1 response regulator [Halorussus sp. JP-T4]
MTATVLLVDDEPSLTDVYESWLSEYEVLVAHDGSEALSILDRRGDGVDVVLLDRRMPGASGDDVLQVVRERDVDCRVAMLTAVAPGYDIIDMPFDDYVTKPVSGEQLRETVESLLARADYVDGLDRYYALASKHAALTAERPRHELAESETFAELEAELRELERDLEDAVSFEDHETFQGLLLEVSRREE